MTVYLNTTWNVLQNSTKKLEMTILAITTKSAHKSSVEFSTQNNTKKYKKYKKLTSFQTQLLS